MVVKKYSILLLMFMSAAWAAQTQEAQKEKTMITKKLDQDTPLTNAMAVK